MFIGKKMLAAKNSHQRDAFVKYNEDRHSYRVEYEVIISVTKLVHLCFPEFKREEVAVKKAKEQNIDINDVYKEWDYLMKMGTKYHKMIEDYLNNNSTACHSGFLDYHNSLLLKGYEPFRTEMTIWGNEIAGTVDALYQHKETKKLLLLDWKHCKKIYKTSVDNTKGYLFLDSLENCNYNHYMIQIGIYRYLLEKFYNYDIEDAYFVNIYNSTKAYAYKLRDYETYWKPLIIKILDFVFDNKDRIKNI
jgi:hypothetical protein